MDDKAAGLAEHGIGVVERRTGISQHVLRAWERRYGVVEPARNAAGERVYSDDDIERLRLVRAATEAGRRISQVATLSLDELRAMVRDDVAAGVIAVEGVSSTASQRRTVRDPESDQEGSRASDPEADRLLDACRAAVRQLDAQSAHSTMMQAAVALGPRRFVDGVALPLLHWVGDEWAQGGLRVMHEHGMSVSMRRVLSWLIEALPTPTDAPLVVCATLPGQRHEFGAMLAGVHAAARGWRVLYLGADLPASEIAAGAVVARADVVAVSVVADADVVPDAPSLGQGVQELRDALPATMSVIVGGAAALQHRRAVRVTGAELLEDFGAWDEWLDEWLDERLDARRPVPVGATP